MLDKVISIDQAPIGRTPRSNPATYTGLFSHIRELFSQSEEADLVAINQEGLVLMLKVGGRNMSRRWNDKS